MANKLFRIIFAVAGQRLKLLLSFAVGGLLGDVFLHLLPEAWQHINPGNVFLIFTGVVVSSFLKHMRFIVLYFS